MREVKKWGGGAAGAYMVDGDVPFFSCRFFIVLNLVFLENACEIMERVKGGEKYGEVVKGSLNY